MYQSVGKKSPMASCVPIRKQNSLQNPDIHCCVLAESWFPFRREKTDWAPLLTVIMQKIDWNPDMCECICSVLVLKQQFVLDAFWQSNLLEHSIYVDVFPLCSPFPKSREMDHLDKLPKNQWQSNVKKNMEKWTHYNSSPIIKKNAWIIRTNHHNFPSRKKQQKTYAYASFG